jgi:hypothetical protein
MLFFSLWNNKPETAVAVYEFPGYYPFVHVLVIHALVQIKGLAVKMLMGFTAHFRTGNMHPARICYARFQGSRPGDCLHGFIGLVAGYDFGFALRNAEAVRKLFADVFHIPPVFDRLHDHCLHLVEIHGVYAFYKVHVFGDGRLQNIVELPCHTEAHGKTLFFQNGFQRNIRPVFSPRCELFITKNTLLLKNSHYN